MQVRLHSLSTLWSISQSNIAHLKCFVPASTYQNFTQGRSRKLANLSFTGFPAGLRAVTLTNVSSNNRPANLDQNYLQKFGVYQYCAYEHDRALAHVNEP